MNTEISLKDIEIPLEPTEEDIKLFGSKVHEVMLELSQADVKNPRCVTGGFFYFRNV